MKRHIISVRTGIYGSHKFISKAAQGYVLSFKCTSHKIVHINGSILQQLRFHDEVENYITKDELYNGRALKTHSTSAVAKHTKFIDNIRIQITYDVTCLFAGIIVLCYVYILTSTPHAKLSRKTHFNM